MVKWKEIGASFTTFLKEADSPAAAEAKRRGLESAGYGKWRIPGGPVMARTVKGKLVAVDPGKKIPKTASQPTKEPTKRPTQRKPEPTPTPTSQAQKTRPNPLDTKPEPKDQDTSGRRIIAGKDKTLRQIETEKTPAWTTPIGESFASFSRRNSKNAIARPFKLSNSYKTGKFPARYIDAVERMANTYLNDQTKPWAYFSRAPGGQGQPSAQLGELMSMISTTMDDNMAANFFADLQNKVESFKEMNLKGRPILDKNWIKAAIGNRTAILQRLQLQYGQDVEVLNGAWDTKPEVEALGLANYHDNKGFSTDVYFKIRTHEGQVILDESSLKQSTAVNFLNSGAGAFKEWDPNLPPEIDQNVYSVKQTSALVKFSKLKARKIANLLRDPQSMVSKTMKVKKIPDFMAAINSKRPNKNVRKIMLHAAIELAKRGDSEAKNVLDASNRRNKKFMKDSIQAISKNPRMKAGMMNAIRTEFPLKAVAEGEETMAIGPYSLDPFVMQAIFGTKDFEVIKEHLEAQEGPPPFIAYRAGPEKLIPIAKIDIREDGVGYRGSFKFDLKLDIRFARILKEANVKVYG